MIMNLSLFFIKFSASIVIDKIKADLSPDGFGTTFEGKHIVSIDKAFFEEHNYITKLIITDTFLEDLPEGIELLTDLESLVFRNNEKKTNGRPLNLNKLVNLKNLKHLDLSGNKMSALGVSIGNLTSLEHLNVSNNDLHYIGYFIKNVPNLKYLDYSYNKINSLSSTIRNLGHILSLNLKGNNLSKLCPEFLALIHLKNLNLSTNEFTEIPKEIYMLSNLRKLSITKNKITSIDFPGKTTLTGVELKNEIMKDLHITQTHFMVEKFVVPRNFFNIKMYEKKGYCFSYLRKLNVNNNQITNVTDAILLFPTLKNLKIEKNPLQSISDVLYLTQITKKQPFVY